MVGILSYIARCFSTLFQQLFLSSHISSSRSSFPFLLPCFWKFHSPLLSPGCWCHLSYKYFPLPFHTRILLGWCGVLLTIMSGHFGVGWRHSSSFGLYLGQVALFWVCSHQFDKHFSCPKAFGFTLTQRVKGTQDAIYISFLVQYGVYKIKTI